MAFVSRGEPVHRQVLSQLSTDVFAAEVGVQGVGPTVVKVPESWTKWLWSHHYLREAIHYHCQLLPCRGSFLSYTVIVIVLNNCTPTSFDTEHLGAEAQSRFRALGSVGH